MQTVGAFPAYGSKKNIYVMKAKNPQGYNNDNTQVIDLFPKSFVKLPDLHEYCFFFKLLANIIAGSNDSLSAGKHLLSYTNIVALLC